MSRVSSRQAEGIRYLGAFLLYLVAAGIWYHAILIHPNSRLPCCISDGTSTVRDYVIAAQEHKNILTFTHDPFNGAPEGTPRAPVAILANSGLQTAFLLLFKGPLGLVAAFNLYSLVGLIGTAIAVFWLLRSLGCTTIASLFGGYVVGFCPDAIARVAAGHNGFTQNWVFVLAVFAAIRVRERRSYASAALLGLVIALGFYISAYQGLLVALIAAVFLLVDLRRLHGRPNHVRSLALLSFALIVNVVALVPLGAAYERNSSTVQQVASHGNGDLLYFGARATAYLLPSPGNPLFHWLAGVHPYGVEQVLFIGFVTMALGACAYVLLFRRDAWLRGSDRRWWTAISLAVLAPVAVIMSLPPAYRAGSSHIPTPSILLAAVTQYWRVYSRIGMVADFATGILASLALTAIADRRPRLGRVLAPAALALVVLELLPGNIPAFAMNARPGWVSWLSNAPHGIVASYPLESQEVSLEQYYYEALDGDGGFAIANGNLGAALSRAQAIRWQAVDLRSPTTARVLSTEQVRYVVINGGSYTAAGGRPPTVDPRYYTLAKRIGNVRIYRVHAPTIRLGPLLRAHEAEIARREGLKSPEITLQSGLGPYEPGRKDKGRRLGSQSVIEADNPGVATQVRLVAHSDNLGSAVTLKLMNGKGAVVARQVVPAGAGELRSRPLTIPIGSHFKFEVVRPKHRAAIYLSGVKLVPVPAYVTGDSA